MDDENPDRMLRGVHDNHLKVSKVCSNMSNGASTSSGHARIGYEGNVPYFSK